MKFFYDCEFLDDGVTIDLISIGIVREDGAEFYAVNRDTAWKRVAKHTWLVDNVVNSLPRIPGPARFPVSRRNPLSIDFDHPSMRTKAEIARDVRILLLSGDREPELWAWYAAYDHVCLAQLWGPMMNLPEGIPMYTHDLKQECDRLGNPELPEQATGEHNALADARHNLVRARALGLVA
jgi:hypothetical protein